MARDPLEVLVGTGTLYVAPQGEAYPATPATAVAGNWEDIGYSESGWTFAVDRTFEDIEVAEEVDRLRVVKTAQTIAMRGVAAQASLEVMQIAFGGGSIADDTPSAGFRTYTPPASSVFTERSILLRTDAPPGDGTNNRDIQCPRVVTTGAVEVAHDKAPQIQLIAVDFELIIPSAGSIFTIVEDKV
jgi:hypothetical protein